MEKLVTDPTEKQWGMFTHLAGLATFIIPFGHIVGPLIIYLIKKDEYDFVKDQGKEVLNFQIAHLDLDVVTFEYASVNDPINGIQYIIIYRPPPSPKNGLLLSTFLREFEDFIGEISLFPRKIIVLGDFNIHVDVPSKSEVKRFLTYLETNDFQQHVMHPTHVSGHILDLIMSRPSDNLVRSCEVQTNLIDHHKVKCDINVAKPSLCKKLVTCRNFKAINQAQFKSDLCDSLTVLQTDVTCEMYLKEFDAKSTILDKHAPEKTRYRTIRPRYPWYNDDIKEQRRLRRRLERRWRKHGSLEDKQAFIEQKEHVNKLIDTAKREFYHEKLATSDAKGISQAVNTLLNKSMKPLPSCDSTQSLCYQFADFFDTKVAKIRDVLDKENAPDLQISEKDSCTSSLTDFKCVSEEEVRKLVSGCPTKTCKLDIIPTWLLKDHLDIFVPYLTVFINMSLCQGTFPKSLGQAIISPIIKKPSLECNVLASCKL